MDLQNASSRRAAIREYEQAQVRRLDVADADYLRCNYCGSTHTRVQHAPAAWWHAKRVVACLDCGKWSPRNRVPGEGV